MANILIIEDDFDTCQLLKLVLRPMGAQLTIVREVNNPIDLIKTTQPAIILLDLYLKESPMDGWELAQFIKSTPDTHHIPIVVLSAGGLREEEYAYQMGSNTFLRKPVDPNDLIETLSHYLSMEYPQ